MALYKQPRSVDVPEEVMTWLKEYRQEFKTETAFAIDLGIDRLVINRIMLVGSCSPRSLKILTKAFNRRVAA